jgi:hypothetical protein
LRQPFLFELAADVVEQWRVVPHLRHSLAFGWNDSGGSA